MGERRCPGPQPPPPGRAPDEFTYGLSEAEFDGAALDESIHEITQAAAQRREHGRRTGPFRQRPGDRLGQRRRTRVHGRGHSGQGGPQPQSVRSPA